VRRRPLSHVALRLLLIGLAVPAAAATRIDLGGPWQFRIDPDGSGARKGWARAVPSPVETVDVPHTWGVGPHAEHEGLAWYWKRVTVPPALRGRRLELHFGATFYRARVFVNGALVGEHEGGHTAWFLEVTRALGQGGLVAVEIDNRPGLATIPGWAMKLKDSGTLWYDWWHYGGIVRDVALVAQERAAIRRQEIRPRLASGRATVATRVFLERFSAGDRLLVDAQVLDPSGRAVARTGELSPRAPAGSLRRSSRSSGTSTTPTSTAWRSRSRNGRERFSTGSRRASVCGRWRSATGGCG
jgi:beta-galactosidase/beta-glucuronidase